MNTCDQQVMTAGAGLKKSIDVRSASFDLSPDRCQANKKGHPVRGGLLTGRKGEKSLSHSPGHQPRPTICRNSGIHGDYGGGHNVKHVKAGTSLLNGSPSYGIAMNGATVFINAD